MTYPFRLGTTSYIIPDDILPNVRYLSGKVIECLLHEQYSGVLTLEVFGEDDFQSSMTALADSVESIWANA